MTDAIRPFQLDHEKFALLDEVYRLRGVQAASALEAFLTGSAPLLTGPDDDLAFIREAAKARGIKLDT